MEDQRTEGPTASWPAPVAPPPGAGAFGGPMLPPPPSPPAGAASKRWIAWAAGIGAVALLVGILAIPRFIAATTGPVRGANAYLTLIRDGRSEAAYGLLCAEAQQAMSPAGFAAELAAEADQNGQLLTFDVYASTVQLGGNTGIVQYRGRASKTGAFAHEARLLHEHGQWKWCGSRDQPKSSGVTVHFP